MSEDDSIEHTRNPKANMDHIYNQPDPRAYFSELHKLDYSTPSAGKPFFLNLIERLRRSRDKSVRVLDLGCSYGVNGALLKHDMTMPQLYEHWGQEWLQDISPEEVVAYGRRFFGRREEAQDFEVIGLDRAERAVAFAEEVGLIDDGVVANLEEHPLPDAVIAGLADVDLMTSTGCIGYVTEKTFERLLPAVTKGGHAPWMANFVLRLWPFEPIEETLSDWGYVTEKLQDRTFRQRRFVSDEEREQVLQGLRERGIDPSGKEAEGHLHTEFFLSRPADDIRQVSLNTLLARESH